MGGITQGYPTEGDLGRAEASLLGPLAGQSRYRGRFLLPKGREGRQRCGTPVPHEGLLYEEDTLAVMQGQALPPPEEKLQEAPHRRSWAAAPRRLQQRLRQHHPPHAPRRAGNPAPLGLTASCPRSASPPPFPPPPHPAAANQRKAGAGGRRSVRHVMCLAGQGGEQRGAWWRCTWDLLPWHLPSLSLRSLGLLWGIKQSASRAA